MLGGFGSGDTPDTTIKKKNRSAHAITLAVVGDTSDKPSVRAGSLSSLRL